MEYQSLSSIPTPEDLFRRSVAELRTTTTRQVDRTRSAPARTMSGKSRAWNLSDKNVAQLRANIEAAKAKRGGKLPDRRGVPDGWAGPRRRRELVEVRERSKAQAETLMDKLVAQGFIDCPASATPLIRPDGTLNEDVAARLALQVAMGMMLAKEPETGRYAYTARDRIKAARIVLRYTRAVPEPRKSGTPTQQAEQTMEEFLARLREPDEDLA
jgi:hypothetical protein